MSFLGRSDAKSVSNCRPQCKRQNHLARRKPGSYLKIPDWVVALIPYDGRQRRQTKLLSALVYRSQQFGRSFFRTLADLRLDCQGEYCRRTIVSALQDLRRARLIEYRSVGNGLWITIAPMLFSRIEKCNRYTPPPYTKEVIKKNGPPRYGKPSYVPYLRDEREKLLSYESQNAESYAAYAARVGVPVALDDWLAGRAL